MEINKNEFLISKKRSKLEIPISDITSGDDVLRTNL